MGSDIGQEGTGAPSVARSTMVGLAAQDRERAVQRLSQDTRASWCGNVARPSESTVRASCTSSGASPCGTTDHECRALGRRLLAFANERRELLGGQLRAAYVEGDEPGARDHGRHATPLALERGVAIAGPDLLLAQLAHRERAVAPETALVLGSRVRERPAGTADEYEVDHPHKSSEARGWER